MAGAAGELVPGDQVGRFRVAGRIGAGGMGVVYRAESADGVRVALKVIRPEFAREPTFRKRFGREVSAARRVQSPVTVAVIDADPEAELPWVAFEYVDGPNLEDVVAARRPRLSAAMGILSGIAEALSAIHEVGIVHRDLKPSNVLCPPDGVKVIDFGIAAAVDATSLTATGGLIGTPAWLAPEQVLGRPITPAVDVFAWGCIAVYVLTGRLAFGADEDTPASLLYRVVNEPPSLNGVPPELAGLIAAALAKRPEDRPTVDGLLRRLLPGRGAGVTASLPGPSANGTVPGAAVDEVVPAPPRRRRGAPLIGAGVAVVVAAVVITAVLTRGGGSGNPVVTHGGSVTTTTPLPTSTSVATDRQILAPATVTPAVDECQMQLSFGADGNAGPLTCSNGDLNTLAWTSLASNNLRVMGLGPFATPTQVTNAICQDLGQNSTNVLETSAYRISALYYGWSFGVDPSDVISNGGCP